MKLARSIPMPVFAALVLGAVSLNLLVFTHGYANSLSNPDEGAHYVNALFLGDWIRAGFPSPMAFARNFYEHFPRLSIGHWPPGWYLLEAPFFALFRPSPLTATVASAFVAGLPGGLVFWAFARLRRPWLGLALGLAYVLLPIPAEATRYILLDQPVALVVGIGAIAWVKASDDPRWWRFLLFAACAAFAPLVKGNGALVALVPAIDIALTRRWHLLRLPSLWIAAVLAIAVVAPWYWLSFKIASGGFVYAPGLDYALLALGANLQAVWDNIGPVGLALALWGGWRSLRLAGSDEARIATLAIAVVAATLVFQSIVPAAVDPRYISPMLPWLVVLAGLGLLPLLRREAAPALIAAGLATAALVPALLFLTALPPKSESRANDIGFIIGGGGGIWMVDGLSGDEGAAIAAAAYYDRGRRAAWVVRASQWLSTSDFLGRGYRLTVHSPAEARALLDRLGVKGTASFARDDRYAYAHSALLNQAVALDGFHIGRLRYSPGKGTVVCAIRLGMPVPHPELIEADPGSANLARITGAPR